MQRLILTLSAAIGAAIGIAGAVAADLIEGTWQTEVDDRSYAHVVVSPRKAGFCGSASRTFNAASEYNPPNVGVRIFREMVPRGGSDYLGRVWRPSNDKVYLGKVSLDGNRMALRGCVAGGLISVRQTWTRVR